MIPCQSLRGLRGSYAQTHSGLDAFWNRAIFLFSKPILNNTLEQDFHADFMSWLNSSCRYLIVAGRQASTCTLLLSRLASWGCRNHRSEFRLLPISSCFGTAVERESLQLLSALVTELDQLILSCTPPELRQRISRGLSEWPDDEEPLILLIDGLHRAADWRLGNHIPFLNSPDSCAKIVISVIDNGDGVEIDKYLKNLNWSKSDVKIINIPPIEYKQPLLDIGIEKKQSESQLNFLDAMAMILEPAEPRELESLLALKMEIPDSIISNSKVTNYEALFTNSNGNWHFVDDAARDMWIDFRSQKHIDALEQMIVKRGMVFLSNQNTDKNEYAPTYLIRNLGAHMVRYSAPRSKLIQLVSPLWLKQWMRESNTLTGFLTDLWHAKEAAKDDLILAKNIVQRRSAIRDLIWCALVETSLLSKHKISNRNAPYCLSYQAPWVDLNVSIGAEGCRVELLMTLATFLPHDSGTNLNLFIKKAKDAFVAQGGDPESLQTHNTHIQSPENPAESAPEQDPNDQDFNIDRYWVSGLLYSDPAMLVAKVGAEKALSLAREYDALVRIHGVAALIPYLPKTIQHKVTNEMIMEYWEDGDGDMLRVVLGCVPWMSNEDRASLLCETIGISKDNMEEFYVGWGGLADLAPLIQYLGGKEALLLLAQDVVEVGQWLS